MFNTHLLNKYREKKPRYGGTGNLERPCIQLKRARDVAQYTYTHTQMYDVFVKLSQLCIHCYCSTKRAFFSMEYIHPSVLKKDIITVWTLIQQEKKSHWPRANSPGTREYTWVPILKLLLPGYLRRRQHSGIGQHVPMCQAKANSIDGFIPSWQSAFKVDTCIWWWEGQRLYSSSQGSHLHSTGMGH